MIIKLKIRYARRLCIGSLLAMATVSFPTPGQNALAYNITPFPAEHRLAEPLPADVSTDSRGILVRYTSPHPTGPGCVLPPRTGARALSVSVLRLLSRPRQA